MSVLSEDKKVASIRRADEIIFAAGINTNDKIDFIALHYILARIIGERVKGRSDGNRLNDIIDLREGLVYCIKLLTSLSLKAVKD